MHSKSEKTRNSSLSLQFSTIIPFKNIGDFKHKLLNIPFASYTYIYIQDVTGIFD